MYATVNYCIGNVRHWQYNNACISQMKYFAFQNVQKCYAVINDTACDPKI